MGPNCTPRWAHFARRLPASALSVLLLGSGRFGEAIDQLPLYAYRKKADYVGDIFHQYAKYCQLHGLTMDGGNQFKQWVATVYIATPDPELRTRWMHSLPKCKLSPTIQ